MEVQPRVIVDTSLTLLAHTSVLMVFGPMDFLLHVFFSLVDFLVKLLPCKLHLDTS
jgi:hypothetical protein